jgi:S-DNA-T family DNA segregation ATPase FtsK/SpoIIIE
MMRALMNLKALNPDDFQLTVKENEAVEMEEAAAVEIPEPETVADEEVEEVEEPEVLEIPEIEIPVAPVLTSMLADLKTDSGLVLEVQETPEEEVLDDTAIAKYGSLDSEYDPTLDYSSYEFPTLDLLNDYGRRREVDCGNG